MYSPTLASTSAAHSSGWLTTKTLRFPRGFSLPVHHHDDACVQVVLDGAFHEHGWGEPDLFDPGVALFRPSGFSHANDQQHGPSAGLSVQFHADGMPAQIGEWIDRGRPNIVRSPHVSSLALRIARELATPDPLSSAIIEALSVELVIQVLRDSATRQDTDSTTSRIARRAVEVIERTPAASLSVEAIAHIVGVDRFELNRAFLKHKGCCPSEFIRAVRVDRAQRLLLRTRRPIASIARECGFADQSHLTRVFSTFVGQTPAKFRSSRSDS